MNGFKSHDLNASLETARTVAALRRRIGEWRGAGQRIGLVPTMGAIHDGHIALMAAARNACDRVVVSLFVNPTQFGPAEDYSGYPRDEARDAALIADAGADLLYAPGAIEIYPDGFATTVSLSGPAEGLCGEFRPGHFAGVATMVAKLFAQCAPDAAWFGEKDYQQLLVIRRMATDLDLPVEVEGAPTVREADGLALSSRNAYLTPDERAIAPALYRTIADMAERLARDGNIPDEISKGRSALAGARFGALDYLEVRDAVTLAPIETVTRPARILVAARLGKARLIDNVAVIPGR